MGVNCGCSHMFSPVRTTQWIQSCQNLKDQCSFMHVDIYYVDMCFVVQVKIKVNLLQFVKNSIPRTNVWHKIISKRSSWKKGIFYWDQFLKIELSSCEKLFTVPTIQLVGDPNPYYKYTTQVVLCILIPQLLKIWKIKFQTV